jgi:ABC-2 type transport system permease protein
MRKTWIVALREYNAAVRTRAFVIGLLIMPLMMGGSALVPHLMRNQRDLKTKHILVVDHTPGGRMADALKTAVEQYNQGTIDLETGKARAASFELHVRPADLDDQEHDRIVNEVRRGEWAGFLEIGTAAAQLTPAADPEQGKAHYWARRATEQEFAGLAEKVLNATARRLRSAEAGLSIDKVQLVARRVEVIRETPFPSVPLVAMILMYMLVLIGTAPLLQGVVEEKMQRIAEVLLGSLSPFQLMLGKLLGMTAVSLTMGVVYLGGALWGAWYFGQDDVPGDLVLWFVFYQTLASLLYGSLWIAIAAACTDMREAQTMVWPVTLLATAPMFMLVNVLRDPGSTLVTAVSMIPFATPTLMITRQAIPPGVPAWQRLAGAAGMVLTTLLCVWIAGRIFRGGFLLTGKGASPREVWRWVVRG